ncbi:hypothetical protein ACIBF5_09630 [Micromonospora sp. NPDC050417]|uniref:hypothetical protein n=1 Tax=Micromonospora sp. NPDC050417 TaxID=3364280 RepID=UPI0037AEF656
MTPDLPVPDRSTPEVARDRAARIRQGIRDYLETVAEIALAWERRDWETLGYATWDAYVAVEFGADRLRLPAEHRQRAVAGLRLAQMSQRAIAAALDIPQSTVRDDLTRARLSGSTQLPERVTGLDGRSRPAERPAAAPATRIVPPDSYVTTIVPVGTLLPGDYLETWLGADGAIQAWELITTARLDSTARPAAVTVSTLTEDGPCTRDRAARDDVRIRRAPGRTNAAGGVVACATCHEQAPAAITYNDRCPACLTPGEHYDMLREALAAEQPHMVPGPHQIVPAARIRRGDVALVDDELEEIVREVTIDPTPDTPGGWVVRARTSAPDGRGGMHSWGWAWDHPVQICRPVEGDATPADPGPGPDDVDPDAVRVAQDAAAEAVYEPAAAPAVLTLVQLGRVRVAVEYAHAAGWRWDGQPGGYNTGMRRDVPTPARGTRVLTDVWWDTDPWRPTVSVGYLTSPRLGDAFRTEDEIGVDGVDQALDILTALGVLPIDHSAAYLAGFVAGAEHRRPALGGQ